MYLDVRNAIRAHLETYGISKGTYDVLLAVNSVILDLPESFKSINNEDIQSRIIKMVESMWFNRDENIGHAMDTSAPPVHTTVIVKITR